MTSKNRSIRFGKVFAGVLATLIVVPSIAAAKPLCFTNDVNAYTLVIPKPKLKPGANAVTAFFNQSGTFLNGLYGVVVVNSEHDIFGFGLERSELGVGANSSGVGPGAPVVVNIMMGVSDGKLDAGDAGTGYIDGAGAIFTVSDCSTAPVIP